MIDSLLRLRAFLAIDAGLTALISSRLYAALDTPPEEYAPADGSAIVFKKRGGGQDESGKVQSVSFQFKCYGGGGNSNAQALAANTLFRALWDALNYQGSFYVLGAQQEGQGTDLIEPETGWPYVLAFFRVQMRNV